MSKWSDWFNDQTGPGEVSQKTETGSDNSKTEHYLRTEDNAKSGSRNDHSHVVVHEKSDGSKTAHGHGIFGGKRK